MSCRNPSPIWEIIARPACVPIYEIGSNWLGHFMANSTFYTSKVDKISTSILGTCAGSNMPPKKVLQWIKWTLPINLFTVQIKLFEEDGVTYILSEKLSRDPLEEHFTWHRRVGGTSENPMLNYFRDKKLLQIWSNANLFPV